MPKQYTKAELAAMSSAMREGRAASPETAQASNAATQRADEDRARNVQIAAENAKTNAALEKYSTHDLNESPVPHTKGSTHY